MSPVEILFHGRFVFACVVYAVMILSGLAVLEWIIHGMHNRFLIETTQQILEPLYRAFVLVMFIFIAYPVLFGVETATPVLELLADGENRTDHLINLVFLTSLILPALPGIGKWTELILPVQAILCCMMVFNWLAQSSQITNFSYWPGVDVVLLIAVIAVFTHWFSITVAKHAGTSLDHYFNVEGFEDLIGQSIILFMQAPAILIYSLELGQQLH